MFMYIAMFVKHSCKATKCAYAKKERNKCYIVNMIGLAEGIVYSAEPLLLINAQISRSASFASGIGNAIKTCGMP